MDFMDYFFIVLYLLGGLAVLLFGMHVMSGNLKKVSGNKMEQMLTKMTDTPLKGVLVGALLTAIIQSSSTTTVMAVGFVNSGLMTLNQSIGIIMGANIGTTITSWLLSLSGMEGAGVVLQLLKPDSLAPVAALIGAVLVTFSNKDRHQSVGSILVGFGLLLYGMDMMGNAVDPLTEDPNFANILVMFENPLLGVLCGAVVTGVIQSSAASIGILLAFCGPSGIITYASALPIIMGQNIGTCATALLSCIGANKNAKRVAMVHLFFNMMGTIILLAAFYGAHAVVNFEWLKMKIPTGHVALIHTAFNLLSTAILLPFGKLLGKLATLAVPDGKGDKPSADTPILDHRLIQQTPSVAVEYCKTAVATMAAMARDTMADAIKLRTKYSAKRSEEVAESEGMIDHYEDELGTYLVQLSGQEISAKNGSDISLMLHAIGDFERIGDHAVNVLESAGEIHEKGIAFSEDASAELMVVEKAVNDILSLAVRAYSDGDIAAAMQVEPLEEVIDHLRDELKARHIARLKEGRCTIELGFIFSDLLNNYERVADHCSNLATAYLESQEDAFNTHMHKDNMKHHNEEFLPMVASLQEHYQLP